MTVPGVPINIDARIAAALEGFEGSPGPQGPQGPTGPQGPAGPSQIGPTTAVSSLPGVLIETGGLVSWFAKEALGQIYDNAVGEVVLSCQDETWAFSTANQNYRISFLELIGTLFGTIQIDLIGGGAPLPVGVLAGQVRVPYACQIIGWELVANDTGLIVVDVMKDSYANFPPTSGDSITGGNPPTITASNKAQSANLTGWATALNSGDYIRVNVVTISFITNATLTLRVQRS